MTNDVYLATVEDPSLWGTEEQTLVLFLQDGVAPVERLHDPTVIGLRPAAGSWSLRLWDEKTHRAFYQAERVVTAL